MNIEQQPAAITDRFLIANGANPINSVDSSPIPSTSKAQLNLLLYSFDNTNSHLNNVGNEPPITIQSILELEHHVNLIYDGNSVLSFFYNSYTQQISDCLVGSSSNLLPGIKDFNFGLNFNTPIGAFYDSQSPLIDNAASIATKTAVLLTATNGGLTTA